MHDSKKNHLEANTVNVNRLDDLMNTIKEARHSLEHWENKKTEAMIGLDSFTYDIKMIEDEKKRTDELVKELKKDLEDQAKIYQSHVSELTDQMQLLKLENENLKNEILSRDFTIETHLKEIENQKLIREQWIKQQQQRENDLRAEFETRSGQKVWELQVKNEGMAAHLVEVNQQKEELEGRTEKLERELMQIRSQMLNVLKAEDHSSHEEKAAFNSPASAPRVSARVSTSRSLSVEEVKKLRPSESEPASVDEYLKRLGY